MSVIKNIIFDLGGVLLNIDYDRTTIAFKRLGYTRFEQMYSMLKGNMVFDGLETGKISEAEFYRYMIEASSGSVSKEQVTDAWNAMLLDFRTESLGFLESLRNKYRIFLLSNTNVIHKRAFDKLLLEQTGIANFDGFFEKAWYSHLVGYRKPHADIFEFVLGDAGIRAGETMYIDDLFPNTETARSLGFKTHLLLPGERIEHLDYS